jgi:hypothetical protein
MDTPLTLADLRVDDAPVPEYIPYIPGTGLVLAFDQAIRNTGWVLVGFDDGNRATIMNCGTLRTKAPARNLGWQSTYASALQMADQIDQRVLETYQRSPITLLVHETPPSSGKMARPDSSIMTGMAVRLAARRHCPQVPLLMIGKQKAANFLLGQPNADKKVIKEFLRAASWIEDRDLIEGKSYNEHQYDALALAVAGQAEMGE